MEPQKKTGALPSVRTFARDLENKRAVVAPQAAAKPTPIVSEPIPETNPQDHEYQTPSWTKQKETPKAPPEDKVVASTAEDIIVPSKPTPFKQQPISKKTAPKAPANGAVFYDTEESADATIISDTKKNRFRLFPAIIASFKAWTKGRAEDRVAKQAPKYTLPDASERKDVIQKATSKTGKVVSFDANNIHERVRLRKAKGTVTKPATIWTANTEPGYPLLEGAEAIPKHDFKVQVVARKSAKVETAVSLKPKVAHAPLSVPPKITPLPAPLLNRASSIQRPLPPLHAEAGPAPTTEGNERFKEAKKLPLQAEEIASKASQSTELTALRREPLPDNIQPAVPMLQAVREESAPLTQNTRPVKSSGYSQLKLTSLRDYLFAIDINTIAVGITGIVLALGIASGAGYLWFKSTTPTLNLMVTPAHESILEAPVQLVPLANPSREAIFATINQNAAESSFEILQMALSTTPRGDTLIAPTVILSAISGDIALSLKNSISKVSFAVIRKTEPVLLLSVTDGTIAQGGILAWEDTLYADLSPLFGNLYSAEEIEGAKFSDSMIGGTDVRTLRTNRNEEMMAYAIIDRQTIVITRFSSTITELIPLVK